MLVCELSISFYAHLQNKEKEIAVTLKWNLNAVTAADFVEELSRRLAVHIPAVTLEKLVEHSHTLASNALLCKWSDPPLDSSKINPVACRTTNSAPLKPCVYPSFTYRSQLCQGASVLAGLCVSE